VTGPSSPARPRLRLALALSVAVLLAPASSASAASFVDVYKDFQKDGAVSACKFSAKDLKKARDQITPDLEQYAPDFRAAVELAIEQRGSGNCTKKAATPDKPESPAAAAPPTGSVPPDAGTKPPAATPAPGATPTPAAPAAATPQPAPAPAPAVAAADGAIQKAAEAEPTSGRSEGMPAAVVGLGALAGFLALVALAWLIARALAWEPRWWPGVRHACQEAGWRASGTWADFTDWVRLGR